MRKLTTLSAVCFLLMFMFMGQIGSMAAAKGSGREIVVEIDYGNRQPSRMVEVTLEQGQTVLDLLQKVATVETHPVSQYVFVAAIDGVRGERGQMAWYYTVDDSSAEKLAAVNVLEPEVRQIKWTYRQDICSRTVDNK